MKRIGQLLLAVVIGATGFFSVAHALDTSLRITDFKSDTTIHQDGSLEVIETLQVNFATPHHGIFRDIPTLYNRDVLHRVSATVKNISVTDERATPYQVAISGGNPLAIKIGDPDQLISGSHTYVIRYTVEDAVLYFKDHDELYWNITGTDWEMPIDSVSATVHLPFITHESLQTACFTGPLGSQTSNCGTSIDGQTVHVGADDFLTVAIGWPKGLIPEPTLTHKITKFFKDNMEYAIPFIIFFAMWLHWYRRGRDPQGHPVFPVQYLPPKDLTPVELGCLMNFAVNHRDIAAEIVSLATKGHLVIKEIETKGFFGKSSDYELTKLTKDEGMLKEHEKVLLDGIFEEGSDITTMSQLKTKLAGEFRTISSQVPKALVKRGYFSENPGTVKGKYIFSGIVMIIASFFLFSGPLVASMLISGGIVILFGNFMPRRTEAGVEALEYVKGLREYIERAEKYRLQFQETEHTFFDLMPYAMVFGVVDKWANAFKDTTLQPPHWYQGSGPFLPYNFGHSMNTFASATHMATTPKGSSFSGGGSGFSGGFSGGGGGGGGGGGW